MGKGVGQKRKPGPVTFLWEPGAHTQSASKRGTVLGQGLEKKSQQFVSVVRMNPGGGLQKARELQLHITSRCTLR